jgi:type IX secretion system PorP/SprF family membrane protein
LAFGLKGGVTLFTADLTSLTGTVEGDPSFSQNLQNAPMPNVGAGICWWSDNHFVGISAPKLLENDLNPGDALEQGSEKRHFFATTGIVVPINSTLKLKPTALVKYVPGAPVSAEIKANLLISEKLWLGGMYRCKTAAGVLMS